MSPWGQVSPTISHNNQWLAPAPLTWRVTPHGFPPRPFNKTYPSYSQKQPQTYLIGIGSTITHFSYSQWYPGSGATHHVTNNVDNFLDSVSTFGSDGVMIGNGQGLSITSIGSISFHSTHNPLVTVNLENFLLVIKNTKNAISGSQFSIDDHVYFEFHPSVSLVKS